MAGNVYVINVTGGDLQLILNGGPAGRTIPGWSSGPADRYRPNSAAVPRTLDASDSPGKFWNGTNEVLLRQLDATYRASIPIVGAENPLNQDLLLLVERNKWQLVNGYGLAVASGDVDSAMRGEAAGEMRDEA